MLYPTYARPIVLGMNPGHAFIVDQTTITTIYFNYFNELLDSQTFMVNEAIRACHEFYDVVGLLQIIPLGGKCLIYDDFTNENLIRLP